MHIVAVDIKPEAKKLAKKYGATELYLDVSESNYTRQSFDVCFDVCFDFCGFQETFEVYQDYVKARGRIVTVLLFHLIRYHIIWTNYLRERSMVALFFILPSYSDSVTFMLLYIKEIPNANEEAESKILAIFHYFTLITMKFKYGIRIYNYCVNDQTKYYTLYL